MSSSRRGNRKNVAAFDAWIRTRFVALNDELEQLYSGQAQRELVDGIGAEQKASLLSEGRELIVPLLQEGNTDQGFESGFDLLGNVGLYMAACRRHEITLPDREKKSPLIEASALAMHLGASLGVTPRFATSHLATHNRAIDGRYKSFTTLDAEYFFLEYNTRGIFAYKRAADALTRILPLGMSHPVVYDLLEDARRALIAVQKANTALFEKLDIDQFFFHIRPYYKPFRVGLHTYRGANAGDFAGINQIDLLLGLCRANDPAYSQQLVDKFLYMMPEDQAQLRDCMRQQSLLDQLLGVMEHASEQSWFKKNATALLAVCEAHGEAAAQHHDQLVSRFITEPSAALPEENLERITASGPPLSILLRGLEQLRDQRRAAERDDVQTRFADLNRLRAALDV